VGHLEKKTKKEGGKRERDNKFSRGKKGKEDRRIKVKKFRKRRKQIEAKVTK